MSTNSYSASTDLEESRFSRWSYQISNISFNPLLPQTPSRQINQPSSAASPPKPTPPPPVEIEQGVWEQDDDILYASNWPPVQKYLATVRHNGQLENAPSDIIFTLAALDVLNHPEDRAHWIFWAPNQYERTGNRVTAITSHSPRLIKSKVSWLGTSSYRGVVHAIQQKFEYIHVRKEWYPVVVDNAHTEARKRTLRSSGGPAEALTVTEYFALDDTLTKKPAKKRKAISTPIANPQPKQARKPALPQSSPSSPVEKSPPAPSEPLPTDSASPVRSSTRVRRKVTPTSRSPRIVSAPTDAPPSPTAPNVVALSPPPLLPPPAIIPSHSRSTSQASIKTVVESERSTSVISSDTVVEAMPSKKRKADDMQKTEDGSEEQDQALDETERMVTRKRASKKTCLADAERNSASSRMSTPQAESPTKTPTRPRARAKRARV